MKSKHILSALLALACMTGCAPHTTELTPTSISSEAIPQAAEIDSTFIAAQQNFAAELFRRTALYDDAPNLLISPLSVSIALALCANGADGDTLAETESVLGMNIEDLNARMLTYMNGLSSSDHSALLSANSVWFRDDESLKVHDSFLQTASEFCDADVFSSPFDSSAVRGINGWVKDKTNGMIEKIVIEIPSSAMLYLINALSFEAEWESAYDKYDLRDGTFTASDGTQQTCEMMRSTETTYLQTKDAVGFIRPYQGGAYSFAAILPDENIALSDWIDSLTGEKLADMLTNAENTEVLACLPKFTAECSLVMNEILAEMGMPTAFDPGLADFSKMARTDTGALFIGQILHKTHIEVDTDGTRAAAVTSVMMEAGGAPEQKPEVILNRPFVYMVLDSANNLPVFMGIVETLNENPG